MKLRTPIILSCAVLGIAALAWQWPAADEPASPTQEAQAVTPPDDSIVPIVVKTATGVADVAANPFVPTMKVGAVLPVNDYRLSGPYTHDNLTIFLIHGRQTLETAQFLTLDEALRDKKAVVLETGSVNQLTIENKSPDVELFIQSGDIIKGGRQDRTLPYDSIIEAKSGQVPIDSFCVEQGRWSQRGKEEAACFNSCANNLATLDLKRIAICANISSPAHDNNWTPSTAASLNWSTGQSTSAGQIATFGALSADAYAGGTVNADKSGQTIGGITLADSGSGGYRAVAAEGAAPSIDPIPSIGPGTGGGPSIDAHFDNPLSGGNSYSSQSEVWKNVSLTQEKLSKKLGVQVKAADSSSSLQLTLETPAVRTAIAPYLELNPIAAKDDDVIGYVAVINGKVVSADVYASRSLFRKLWPKLLEGSALEAFIEADAKLRFEPIAEAAVRAFLVEAENGKESGEAVTKRTYVRVRIAGRTMLHECCDRSRDNLVLHRSILAGRAD